MNPKGNTYAQTMLKTAALLLIATAYQSCAKWTEPEYINYQNLGKDHPDSYYADLVAYKQSNHKVSIAVLDGTTDRPVSQSQHLMSMPDSLDYICMRKVSGLHPSIAQEIPQVREKKGTKVICDVDYASIAEAWREMENEGKKNDAASRTDTDFSEFVASQTAMQLQCCDQYAFDGIMVSFRSTSPDTDDAGQKIFMKTISEWRRTHSGHHVLFSGYPNRILDQNFFSECRYILVPMGTLYSTGEFTRSISRYCDDLPEPDKAKIVLELNAPSADYPQPENAKKPQPVLGAEWVLEEDKEFVRCGISVDNIRDDYNSAGTYAATRKAIRIMNSQTE